MVLLGTDIQNGNADADAGEEGHIRWLGGEKARLCIGNADRYRCGTDKFKTSKPTAFSFWDRVTNGASYL